MAVHEEMYARLFRQVTKTIEELQEVQRACEEMYMRGGAPPLQMSLARNAAPVQSGRQQGDDEQAEDRERKGGKKAP